VNVLETTFAGAFLGLIGSDGREVDDAGYGRQRLHFKISEDRADLSDPVRFGPWRQGNEQVAGWVIYGAGGEIIDCGPLLAPRWPLAGDEIIYSASSIRAAALGDILGATFVFMPSGFVAVTPPTPTIGFSPLVGYAEPEELARPFWLPKRRWAFMPENPWLDSLKSVTLPPVDVGAKEYLRSFVIEAMLGVGVIEV
jgi:hypothetical protein